ncbi:hypothetical protein [Streptomyces katrae]|uniref:hypothetical protein n=1 Tax=Streptomyces katrae TaxID=68223 RepID=UPI0006975610|nr:hypothetical protein [Streptomyces katrae]
MSQNFQPPAPSSYTPAPAQAPARKGNVGFAAAKAGGRNAVLPVVAALVSVVSVLAGQLFGIALDGADQLSESVVDVLTNRTSEVIDSWKEGVDPLTFLFLAIGGYAAFQVGRKTA